MPKHRRKLLGVVIASVFLYGSLAHAADTASFWHPWTGPAAPSASRAAIGTQAVVPSHYRALSLDFGSVQNELSIGATAIRRGQSNNFALPIPEGGMTYFVLSESDTMPAALAARYPQIKSYKGVDAHGRRLRLDVSPQGMQATVYDEDGGQWLVQRAERLSGKVGPAASSGDEYWSFRREALPAPAKGLREEGFDVMHEAMRKRRVARKGAPSATPGTQSYNYGYRAAIAATSRFTAKLGGTVEGGLAGVVAIVNRLNEVYENDFNVHLTLVADEDKIIYTDAKTDPYDGYDVSNASLRKNEQNLKKVIGNANFDVGHLVDSGADQSTKNGLAELEATCQDDVKAGAHTSYPNPAGDPFAIDYVAHEMGHSFGANHTFNGCGGNRNDATAFEPGSGSTIMAYAGICDDGDYSEKPYDQLQHTFDLQPHSDPYFHNASIGEIRAWTAGDGGACASKVANTNNPPVIDAASLQAVSTTIPALTPFVLKAKVRDSNPDARLAYAWEEMDAGSDQTTALKDDGHGPIFRSYNVKGSSERTFPRKAAVLGYEPLGNGEVYPATNRTLNFRLVVRDNQATSSDASSGPTTTLGQVAVRVVKTGSAFAVTAPATSVTWKAGSTQAVKWQVAGTDLAPISCAKVRIELSTDGGYNYGGIPLLRNTENDGEAEVTVPAGLNTSKARLRVSCENNIFFAVSPKNITISS